MKIRPENCTDCYKLGHINQFPEDTIMVYSNFTPRNSKYFDCATFDGKVVFFGLQYYIKDYLVDTWNREFFNQPKEKIIKRYARRVNKILNTTDARVDHMAALHDLGYLPIEIKSLDEGSRVNNGVPVFTIKNTVEEFFWLTNYLETDLSASLWKPCTSATTAFQYKKILSKYAKLTGTPDWFVDIQGHDFSYRGMSYKEDAACSGAAHLTSFSGTDTIVAIDLLEDYYGADVDEEVVGGSVPATEHAVMCMGTKEREIDTFRRLINETYSSGVISIVSDTWDFWQVVTEYVAELKDDILARNDNPIVNKVVIRPDSGDPVKIICGDPEAAEGTPEHKGAIQCLWDVFGGETTEQGYKLLDSHIGLIYGDSITLARAEEICSRLMDKGFASGNVVLGIGSFTYEMVTRDTHGFAMKATAGIVDGEFREIFKDPKTDDGTKKSAKGLLRVDQNANGDFVLTDQVSFEVESEGCLVTRFKDGVITNETTFADIKNRLNESI